MAIQFLCPSCSQPIEVDDEFAGKAAACPYCQRVANVPMESTFRPGATTQAQPVSTVEAPGPGPAPAVGAGAYVPAPAGLPTEALHYTVSPPSRRERLGRRLGWGALACTVLLAGLIVAMAAFLFSELKTRLADEGISTTGAQRISPEQMARVEQNALKELSNKPWVLGVSVTAELLTVLGLVLAIVSVICTRRRNWPGIVALVICGVAVLCTCGAMMLQMRGGLMPTG